MPQSTRNRRYIRFGVFEVDLRAGELRKQGLRIRIQEKPFQVLAALLERPGDVLSREELRSTLWPDDTFVDFDHSINIAINKLREALGDSAETPRFIETLASRGYRFVAAVDREDATTSEGQEPPRTESPEEGPERPGWVSLVLVALLALGVYFAWKRYWKPPPPQGKIRLVVLPFDNLTGDPQQDYFVDGLTEELIARLGGLHPQSLGVIARTTSLAYKHTTKPTSQIGLELNVQYVLEGSVRRAGQRVSITAELIRANDQTHVWANSYERDLRDVLAIWSGVAQDIARQTKIELSPQEQEHLKPNSAVDTVAHEAYLNGRFYWNKRTPEDLKKAIGYFDQAIARDPKYAPAYAGLADTYSLLGTIPYDELPPREAMPNPKAAARQALALDETLAEAHVSLAYALLTYDWNWPGAEKEFKRALELNPSYAPAHHFYALYLTATGHPDQAIGEEEEARKLDPYSPTVNVALAQVYEFDREYDKVIEQCQSTLEKFPDFYLAHYYLGVAYEQKGLHDQAITEFQEARKAGGGSMLLTMALGRGYALAGRKSEARNLLKGLIALSSTRYVPALYIAGIYSGLGDRDQVFRWLNKAFNDRSDYLVYIRKEPISYSLAEDPRFQDLLRRMNFPP